MKGFQQTLGDAEVAALASYLRSQWGHRASPVEAEQVKLQR
ncbi:MAG: c-type cytochrome [Gammaproteobacteria bacterium]